MTPDAFLELVNTVEERHPVTEWRVGDTPAWPVVRARAFRAIEAAKARESARPSDPEKPPVAAGLRRGAAGRVLAGAVDAVRSNLRDPEHRVGRRLPRADIVLLGDGLSRVEVDGVWYDRFCDPLAEAAAAVDLRTVQLEPHHRYRVPRATPSRYVQPGLDVLDLVTRVLPPRPPLRGRGAQEGLDALRDGGIPAAATDITAIARETILIEREAARFSRLVGAARPDLAVLVDYTPAAMAFVLAARQAGIPAVEVQHAIPPPSHPMYARWCAVPPGGFSLLPTHYWTWTESPAAVLRAWADEVPAGPQALVGGNPWLERWLRGEGEVVRRYDERIGRQRAGHAERRQALLTFETTFSGPGILDPLLDAMAATQASVRWWHRLHPTTPPDEAVRVRAALAARGLVESGADVTDEPLYALLRHADVHVTYASSTTQEAAVFGVPTVLTAPHAADVYPDLVKQGWAFVATTADAITRAVTSAQRPAREPARVPPPPPAAILRELVIASRADS